MSSLQKLISRSRIQLFAMLTIGVALIGTGLIGWLWVPGHRDRAIRIAGGVDGLNRYSIARYLRRHATDLGLEIELFPCEDTIQATRMVENREVDLALVNGLVRSSQAASVRQIAVISTEQLHFLAKQEYAERLEEDLSRLGEFTIFGGLEGGETELIGRALLEFCGVESELEAGRLSVDRRTRQDLLMTVNALPAATDEEKGRMRSKLPDVVLLVSTLPSPLARKLIRNADYQLLPLPFSEAFGRISVDEDDLDRDHIDQVLVDPAVIPAYMYGATPPVPAQDSPSLGCPLVLITHRDVSERAISRLLPAIFEGPVQRVYHPPAIGKSDVIYPLHPASVAFRDRDKPLVRADVIEAVRMVFGIAAPMVGGFFALFGFYRWRQTLRFLEYFEQYQHLDRQAKGLLSDSVVTPAEADEARQLETKLTELQQQAVTDFCKNYFYADGVLETFLQLLSETRNFLRTSAQQSTTDEEDSPDSNSS